MIERKWIFTSFENSWIQQILDLRFKIFNQKNYSRKRWDWQYKENPQGNAQLALATDKNNQEILVGHYALMAYKIKYGEEVLSISQSVDTFSSTDFRNQGIFVGLASIAYEMARNENICGIFGFPNTHSYPGFVKNLDFKVPFSLHFWVKPVSFGVIFKKLKIPSKIGTFFGIIPLIYPLLNSSFETKEVESIPEDWEVLQRKFEHIFPICIFRDRTYMLWRYFNCPDRKYKFLKFEKSQEIIGFAVLAISNDGYPTGQIIDLLVSDLIYTKEFIQTCSWKLKSMGAHTIVTYLHKENLMAEVYYKLGFSPRGSETKFIFKDLNHIKDFEGFGMTASNWYISGGDTDYL